MFVELEDLKRYLRRSSATTDDDDDLVEHLQSAIDLVEAELGDVLTASGVGREFAVYADGTHLILPVTRLVEVTEVVGPDGDVVEPAAVNLLAGVVVLPRSAPGTYTVTATVRDHSDALRLAVKITAAHLVATAPRGSAERGAGRFTSTPGADEMVPTGFALPRRAEQLIATAKAVTPR